MITQGKINKIDGVILRGLPERTKRIDPQYVRRLDEKNPWLRRLNLRLTGATEIPVVTEVRNMQGEGRGIIQEEMKPDLELTAAVSALGPIFFGSRKAGIKDPASWDKAKIKILIDRAAAAVQGLAFNDILNRFPDWQTVVAASEGGRIKPGREDEVGGNPATYIGQRFGRGNRYIYIAIDNVDRTGATVEGLHSAVTAFIFTSSPTKAIPDLRLLKIVSGFGFNPELKDIDAVPIKVTEAIARAAGINTEQVNATNLLMGREKRLQEPTDAYRDAGVTFWVDADGDVMPAIASGLRTYAMPNGKPLHAMLAAAGGSAEGGLLLPVEWLGGKVLLSFASADGFKTWATRKSFQGKEEKDITEADFNPWKTILMKDIYMNPFADGVGVFGGISNNLWIPDLRGAVAGENMAEASVLSVTPQGFASIKTFTFDYEDPQRNTTAGRFEPLIYTLRKLDTAGEIKTRVAAWMKTMARRERLEREWRHEYYPIFDAVSGGCRIDMAAFNAQMGKRYDERDQAILSAIATQTPWIVESDVPYVSEYKTFIDQAAFARREANDPAVLAEQMIDES
jgi:fructose-1,6-bisphosphatase/sedoheptulose 1,7-bisphosphatase-like protein